MELTSVNNETVKYAVKLQQKKYRNTEKKFLLEGFKAISEAFDSGIKLEHIFVTKNKISEYSFCKESLIEVSEPVLKKISTTDSIPEAVAIGHQKFFSIEDLKNVKKVLLLEDIKDSGNLGTILRSAVAFGADAVILYGDCVDIYNPKTVRASVGNLWKIPIVQIKNLEIFIKTFKGFNKIATLPRSTNLLKQYKLKLPAVIMFGSEANGLSDNLIKISDESVKIEMSQKVESLNLATSVSVILYELF